MDSSTLEREPWSMHHRLKLQYNVIWVQVLLPLCCLPPKHIRSSASDGVCCLFSLVMPSLVFLHISNILKGFFMQKDYKMFPPSVNWDNIDWSTRRPQMDFPVQSAICSLEDVNVVNDRKVTISGYAVSGGGRGIERVDISTDGGKTWMEASRYQKPGIPYVADSVNSDKWAWVLFELTVEIPPSAEIVAKAVDSSANVQPENVEDIWNLRGILNTSWHRVHLQIGRTNM